ncbi:MAG: TVP38/TMEM64 family protein [Betaproteobacteria bacterium]|nr:TVP38/TMEM64 family protein [Gammaproteobacteria bacterium]MDH3438757.1 TVP38/TMEM64 family protein [Betaproteobacteria bacterium]
MAHSNSNRRLSGPRIAALIAFLLVLGVSAWWLLAPPSGIRLDMTVEGMAQLIRSWGGWGVAVSIGLMVIHSFVPFPAEILACANGMIYGPVWGTVITWIGAMLGASVAFGLARSLGRPFVQRMLKEAQREKLAFWSRDRGGIALLTARLIPVIAFNLINYAAALTEISWSTFLWATAIGILPLTALSAILGDRMLTMPLWGWLLLAAVVLLTWFWLERRWRIAQRPSR